jgi:hypothetical protein
MYVYCTLTVCLGSQKINEKSAQSISQSVNHQLVNQSIDQTIDRSIHPSINYTKNPIHPPINQSILWTDLPVVDDHGELAELSLQPILLLQQLHPVLLRTSL